MSDPMLDALARVAEAWRDPAYPPRAEAVRQTLAAPNRFTGEALTFALNQQMARLAAVEGSIPERALPVPVGVVDAGEAPLSAFFDFWAVVRRGHRYVGRMAEASPFLLPAFVEAVQREAPHFPATFVEGEAVFAGAEAILAPADAVDAETCARHGIPPERCLLRASRHAVAVIDGRETEDEREGLAEDILLHDGHGAASVGLLWAPRGHRPDALLESFAHFRAVFPVHPATPGALAMQKAFLDARDVPHAYGDGLEFLLSRGAPEIQPAGHLRWAEYDALEEVTNWLGQHAAAVSLVVARTALHPHLAGARLCVEPGEAHRPPLGGYPDPSREALLDALTVQSSAK